VRALWHELDVQTPHQLAQAAREHRIRELPGFGPHIEANILHAVDAHLYRARRVGIAAATQYATSLVAWLASARGVMQVELAGSYRRCRETVGDLDILATAAADSSVMARFAAYDERAELLARGPTRAGLILVGGLPVALRVVAEAAQGAALCHFTGSKAHHVALRRLARAQGLKLNEQGVFRGRERIAGDSEESVYEALGLAWIPPPLREDRGEIEAARQARLPQLVQLRELRGDLHAHTTASDGHHSLEQMALAARARGLTYLAITDHSRRANGGHGLDPRRLVEQCEAIDRLNEGLDGIVLLKGVEVDILEDGALDLPDSALARLDLVIGAVHSHFDLSRRRQTERILRAMDHRYFTLLAHPNGRLIDQRAPCELDIARIIRGARQRGCYLELNANPERLDLNDSQCQMAREEGVLVALNSDAHGCDDLARLRFGIGQAQRGWLQAADVLNTRPLAELRPLLAATRR
jgi:DNA polymerase (family 10)